MVKIKRQENSQTNDLINQLLDKQRLIEFQKTELEEKQLELQESLDKLADLYDYAPNGYLTINANHRLIEINQTGADMLGVNKNNFYNIPFLVFIDIQDIPKFMSMFRIVKQQKKQASEEIKLISVNKKSIIAHIIITPVHDFKSKKLNFRISLTDLTEKKEIENALKESEERFRTMADSAPVMVWMSDQKNNLLYANSLKLRFLGKTFEQIKGQKWLDLIHPDDRENYLEICAQALRKQENFSIEMRVKSRDKEYRWVIRSGAPTTSIDGKSYGLIGSEMDITERKRQETIIQKSLHEKETLLKEIHHRVKNNLQIISSLLNLQMNYIENPELSGILKASQSRIRSMALIHEKLYKSSELSTINFSEYIRDLVSFLFKTYRNQAGNVKLDMMLSEVNLDINLSLSLGLILNELITNSLKHAFPERRGGVLKISLIEDENLLELVVSDNGIGLPPDFNIKKVNSLGLELVETLINQHHAELEINQNGMTEFKVLLHRNSKG